MFIRIHRARLNPVPIQKNARVYRCCLVNSRRMVALQLGSNARGERAGETQGAVNRKGTFGLPHGDLHWQIWKVGNSNVCCFRPEELDKTGHICLLCSIGPQWEQE